MKKVVALKDYSDNYYILREGMIYNLIDSIADKKKEKEVCATSTGSPDDVVITQTVTSGTEIANVTINGQSTKLYAPAGEDSGESNILIVSISSDNNEYTADKTYSEIVSAIEAGKFVVAFDSGKEYHLEKTFQCHDLPISKVYFNHKGDYFLTCSYDGDAYLWDRKTGLTKYKIKNHANTINSVVFTHDDQQLLTGSFDCLAMLFDANNGIRIKTFEGHTEEIVEVNMNNDENKFCTASMDTTSKIFDIEEGKCIITLKGHTDVVSRAKFNKESNMILTGSYDKSCKIFDLNDGNVLFDFNEHTKEISNCFFYPKDNNIIISTSLDGLLKIYDIRKGNASVNTFDEHFKKEIFCSTISSNGKFLATGGGDNSVGHNKEIYSVDFTYGEETKYLVSGDGLGECRLWDVNTGECKQIIESGEETEIIASCFNEKNSDILIADVDNIVRLYTNEIPVNY